MTNPIDGIQRPKQAQDNKEAPERSKPRKKARVASRTVANSAQQHPSRTKFYVAVGVTFAVVVTVWALTFRWGGDGKGENLLSTIAERIRSVFSSDEGTTTVEGTVLGEEKELDQLKETVFPQFTEAQ